MYNAQKLIAGLILALTAGSASAVTVFECEDDKGNRTFESACPPGTTKVQQKDYAANGGDGAEETSGELPEVTLYLVPECETCIQTRDFLTARDIPYTTKDVKSDFALQEELKKRSGELRAPTVLIGEKAVVGFNRAGLIAALQASGHMPAEEGTVEGATGEAGTGGEEPNAEAKAETPAP